MHTEVTKTTSDSKLIITSDPGDRNNNNMQQDKLIDERIHDRKKRMQTNDGKEYQNTSPRRNNSNNNRYGNNRIPSYNGIRQNRNGPPQQQQQPQQQFINNNSKQRLDTNNNNSHKYDKMQHQHSNFNNYNTKVSVPTNNSTNTNNSNAMKSDNYQEILNGNNNQVKKPVPKHRVVKSTSASSNYDDYSNNKTVRVDTQLSNGDKNISDDSGINLNTSVSTSNNSDTRLQYDHLMAGDNESINRKYSMDFLHQVGHHYKNISSNSIVQNKTPQKQLQNPPQPKVLEDNNLIALKMAFGDNSGYYNHLYSGAMYTNQLFFQHQQQYQQNYPRYQNQHMQQRVRVYPRQDNNNYQRIYQPEPQINRQQPQQQPNSYHNGYYNPQQQQQHQQQQQQNNSFQFQNHRAKQNRDQNRKNRQNGNNNNANSTNDRNNFNINNSSNNNKKLSDQNARLSHSKSDSAQYEENKRKNLMYIRTNSEDYRSLSPTPPSSVKSASPGIQEIKNCDTKETTTSELIDDSASNSSTQSAMSFSSGSKELPMTPTILLTPTSTDNEMTSNKENNVNSWINNNNFTPINNVLSASAEQLNLRPVETPITIIKRPPSANGMTTTPTHPIPRNFTLPTYDPTYPFDYYFARGERCEMREEPINLSCGSIWDHVSLEIWNKFQVFQQTRDTYRSKMILWRDLYEFIKVS